MNAGHQAQMRFIRNKDDLRPYCVAEAPTAGATITN